MQQLIEGITTSSLTEQQRDWVTQFVVLFTNSYVIFAYFKPRVRFTFDGIGEIVAYSPKQHAISAGVIGRRRIVKVGDGVSVSFPGLVQVHCSSIIRDVFIYLLPCAGGGRTEPR